MTRLSSTRPRTRRSSAHKYIASGSRSHIPSLRAWMRQADVAQRRHASSRTAVETPRHPHASPDERHMWQKAYRDVVEGSDTFVAEDAWRAYQCLCDSYGEAPRPPSKAIAFMAHLVMSVAQGEQGALSKDLLRLWGTRIQEALHHIDPGIQGMPQNTIRIQWNLVRVSALAMTGKIQEAAEEARDLFHICDSSSFEEKMKQRGHVLLVYTVILHALGEYKGPSAVLDFLTEESKSLFEHFNRPPWYWKQPSMLQSVTLLQEATFSILSRLDAPVRYLQSSSGRTSKGELSFAGSLLVRAMQRGDRPKDALAVARFMQQMSIYPMPEVALAAVRKYVREGLLDEAATIFSTLPSPSNHYRSHHSTGLLLCSRQGDVQGAEAHYRSLAQRKFASSPDKNAIMHAYAMVGQPDRVVELFNDLFPPTSSTNPHPERPNLIHYTTVIYAYSRVGDIDGVNTWLGRLIAAGFKPDLHVYSIILETFADRGDLPSMISVLDQMRESKLRPSAVICTSIISALARRNDPISAERVYKRALEDGVVPDRRMVTAIMNAHVESGSWQGVIRAWDYLNTAGRQGAGLTIEVFNTLLKAYVLIGAPFRTVANLFRQLSTMQLRPDSRTFALLIQSACDSGLMDIAEELYAEMNRLVEEDNQKSLQANIYVLTILMSGYLRQGKRVKAKAILDDMKSRNIEPTAITYAAILKAYSEQKHGQGTQVAEGLLTSLMGSGDKSKWLQMLGGRRLTIEAVYRPLLNTYAQREEPANVTRLYDDMLRSGGEPSLGTLTMLLDAYRRAGNIDGVETIWPEIHRLGIEFTRQNTLLAVGPDESPNLSAYGSLMCVPFSILIDALSAAGKHAEVAQTWKALKDQGLQFDSHNWNHLVAALVRAGEPLRAFDIVENVILRYQHQSRRELERGRDPHPTSPLTLDLPPPEEGDLPPHRPEAPLHTPARRTAAAERSTRRLRNRLAYLEEKGSEDFVHPLVILHTMSPLWNTWRPHGATLVLLGRVLAHFRSGRLVQAVQPETDSEFVQSAIDAEEIRKRTEAAGVMLGEIYELFPRTVPLVTEYELMRRTSAHRYNDAAAQGRS